MNNPSGMSQAEMMALMGLISPVVGGRAQRRAKRANGASFGKPSNDRKKRREKGRAARRARARNRHR